MRVLRGKARSRGGALLELFAVRSTIKSSAARNHEQVLSRAALVCTYTSRKKYNVFLTSQSHSRLHGTVVRFLHQRPIN